MSTMLACSGDTTGPLPKQQSLSFWVLSLNWHAVNMALVAPYDTTHLVATPKAADGTVLSTTNKVQYTTSDSTVTVSSSGVVTARYVTALTFVVATMTVNGVTLSDTARIQVTETPLPAPVATLSIQPTPDNSDGLVAAHDNVFTPFPAFIPVYATIATGDPATDTVCNLSGCQLLVDVRSSDSSIAWINPTDPSRTVSSNRTGRVTLYASTLAYGVGVKDSLSFSVGYAIRLLPTVLLDSIVTPHVPYVSGNPLWPIEMSIGGRIFISNQTGDSLEVTLLTPGDGVQFQALTDPAQIVDTLAARGQAPIKFTATGTYKFRYRVLSTGTSVDESFHINPYP